MARCPYDAKHANVALFAGEKPVVMGEVFVRPPSLSALVGTCLKLNGRAEYI